MILRWRVCFFWGKQHFLFKKRSMLYQKKKRMFQVTKHPPTLKVVKMAKVGRLWKWWYSDTRGGCWVLLTISEMFQFAGLGFQQKKLLTQNWGKSSTKRQVMKDFFFLIYPRKLTWKLKKAPWKRKNVYKSSILGFHVSFLGVYILPSRSLTCSPLKNGGTGRRSFPIGFR